eukprot:TRINITY_DN739_c0_g1_i3.p1 TRINITY_DN739_c0_g1~~TRINITY_DN739_c0_g1_i3.p1  ORF type:complete len:733 (-),score=314.86 TRINITY_DN739_c0_g1_i3:475-2628(-)
MKDFRNRDRDYRDREHREKERDREFRDRDRDLRERDRDRERDLRDRDRDRDLRERDRDRDRDRDLRDRDRDRDYLRDRDRDRYEQNDNKNESDEGGEDSYSYFEENEEFDKNKDFNKQKALKKKFEKNEEERVRPSSVILLRGIHPNNSVETITDHLKVYGPLEKIKFVKDRVTGEQKGIAFAEFVLLEDAVAFREAYAKNNYKALIDGALLQIEYSKQAAKKNAKQPKPGTEFRDWLCPLCQKSNFARRIECYSCHAPKPENPEFCTVVIEEKEVPSPVLVLRGLDVHTTEDTIRRIFAVYGTLRDIRLIKDRGAQTSRGFCFVEYYTNEEATLALKRCGHLMLDGRQIKISYAKQPTPNQNQIANANAALEQARWFSQVRQPNEQDTGGYIYDNNTGLYFDPNTQYYYDPKTQQYLYYDANTKAYVPFQQGAYETQNQSIYQENIAIDTTKTNEKKQQLNDKQIEDIKKNDSNSEANNTQNLENKSVQVTLEPTISTINIQPSKMNAFNNVKPAPNPVAKKKDMVKAPVKFSVNKKITIELNRWNQVSQELNNPEQSKEPQPIEIMPILSISTAQSNNIISDLTTNVNNPVISSTIGTSTVLTDQTISTKSSETVQQSTNVIEQKLSANICLLCKRQFDSAEKLAKHVELSDLHKKNLEIAKLKQQQAQKDNSLVGGNNNSGSSGNSGLGSGKHGWDFDVWIIYGMNLQFFRFGD